MILVRTIFRAKFGKGGEVAAGMIETARQAPSNGQTQARVLTDLSGEFDTVVLEAAYESLAAWEQFRAQMFTTPEFRESQSRIEGLIVSGHQEYFTIEAEF